MVATQAVETGISFALTEEQRALRELAHEFAVNEIRPVAAEHDEHQTHPADVIAKAHEVGLMNLHIPPELGGPGRGQIQYLASLFHPDGPNDVAPGPYNDPEPTAGLPGSPLPPRPAPTGFRWGFPDA